MIGVQSLWTQPPNFKLTRSLALLFSASVAYAGRALGDIELVTDVKGLRIADRLRWEFTTFVQTLEKFAPREHWHMWSLGKIKALSIQRRPCVHIDLDLCLLEPFPERVLAARVAAQSKDCPGYYWQNSIADYMRDCGVPQDTCTFNTAITLWNDLDLKDEYCSRVFKTVEKVGRKLKNGTILSLVAEQGIYGALMRERRVKVEECIPLPEHVNESDFDFHFCHFWGKSKNDRDWSLIIEQRFKRDFPEKHADFERGFEFLLRDGIAVKE